MLFGEEGRWERRRSRAREVCASPPLRSVLSVFAVVAVWREVTYRGFLPLPAAVLPLLCLTGLGLSARSWSRSAEFGGKAVAALGVVLSLGALVVVLLLLVVALLYVGS